MDCHGLPRTDTDIQSREPHRLPAEEEAFG